MTQAHAQFAHSHAHSHVRGVASDVGTVVVEPDRVAKRPRALVAFVGATVVALGIATSVFLAGRGRESTDDAQVEGHIASIAPRIRAEITRVLVNDDQEVAAGDLLVELDHRELDARVASAKADYHASQAVLAGAELRLSLAQREHGATKKQAHGGVLQAKAAAQAADAQRRQARAELDAARARDSNAWAERGRLMALVASNAVSASDAERADTAWREANAALALSRARVDAASAAATSAMGVGESAEGKLLVSEGDEEIALARARVDEATAHVEESQAALDVAELNASFAYVRTPQRGVVSSRSAEIGQSASPERALLAIVPTDDVWVVADFKEDQIAAMRAGQRARVQIDTFGRHEFVANVASIGAATGARFALLPPDNASGNFVKVVQRVPVVVRLVDVAAAGAPLRPGMSATVTVDTR